MKNVISTRSSNHSQRCPLRAPLYLSLSLSPLLTYSLPFLLFSVDPHSPSGGVNQILQTVATRQSRRQSCLFGSNARLSSVLCTPTTAHIPAQRQTLLNPRRLGSSHRRNPRGESESADSIYASTLRTLLTPIIWYKRSVGF